MRKWLLLIMLVPGFSMAQVADSMSVKRKAYRAMLSKLLDHSVNELRTNDPFPKDAIWLDARAWREYEVSHLEGAKFVGYDDFKIKSINEVDRFTPIIVYCSVGYRSEKVAEKLEKAGYAKVYNLLGGIFEWHNEGKPVVDSIGNQTDRVHGYNTLWGQWLDQAEVVYE